MYGSEKEGYCYYDKEQEYVRGSRSQYVHRQLYQLFASARYIMYMYNTYIYTMSYSHHAWCSFEGSAEMYNEMVRQSYASSISAAEFFKERQLTDEG